MEKWWDKTGRGKPKLEVIRVTALFFDTDVPNGPLSNKPAPSWRESNG
jgi:hypothetical protein